MSPKVRASNVYTPVVVQGLKYNGYVSKVVISLLSSIATTKICAVNITKKLGKIQEIFLHARNF